MSMTPNICQKYAYDMLKTCLKLGTNMQKISTRWAKDIPNMPRYAWNIPMIYLIYAQDMLKVGSTNQKI